MIMETKVPQEKLERFSFAGRAELWDTLMIQKGHPV
jgi:hypothetical protein